MAVVAGRSVVGVVAGNTWHQAVARIVGSPASGEGDLALWQGSAEVRSRALEGARRCVTHWADMGDGSMLDSALARYHRIRIGYASVCEVQGALDWLD